jgi:hypothetical protein
MAEKKSWAEIPMLLPEQYLEQDIFLWKKAAKKLIKPFAFIKKVLIFYLF